MGQYSFAAPIEAKWRNAWQTSQCFQAPEYPTGEKFFNFDSGPFANGTLHLGHVRTYVLGDMTARFQRLRGRSVLYATEWDAFGLPNEAGARDAGVSPFEFTASRTDEMRRDLQRLGTSYDWDRVQSTCDPAYYRWTQWLFLLLLRRGLVSRRQATSYWCSHCRATVALMQASCGLCWRCNRAVEIRKSKQWFVEISRYAQRLNKQAASLAEWSPTAKKLIRPKSQVDASESGISRLQSDWSVSRRKSWGTPIPVVHCPRCGIVPDTDLPVRLPTDLDWSNREHPLAEDRAFAVTTCPSCGAAARRETDTLDCFFDDAWSLFSCVTDIESHPSFPGSRLSPWLAVDKFHSGFDTHVYLNLYRFIGQVLHDECISANAEPITSYSGHKVVTSGTAGKMSKRMDTAISARSMLQRYGADAVRVGMLWAASPNREVVWSESFCVKAEKLLGRIYRLYSSCTQQVDALAQQQAAGQGSTTRALDQLESQAHRTFARVANYVDDYRPNAAIEELAWLTGKLEDYSVHRVQTTRLAPKDAAGLQAILMGFAIALSPFAPFLAEEVAVLNYARQMACLSRWPGRAASGDDASS